jgi:hypothetical protein
LKKQALWMFLRFALFARVIIIFLQDDEGICETHTFTESGLLKVMGEAVKYLKQADLYETANELYKLIIPISEKSRNYESLAKNHLDLHEIFSKIISSVSQLPVFTLTFSDCRY